MKLKGILIGIVLPIFFLSSCSGKNSYVKIDPVLIFSCTAITTVNGEIIKYNLVRSESKETKIRVEEPKSISGLEFTKLQDETIVDYNGLSIKKDSLLMPIDSSVLTIMNVFEYLENKSELEFVSCENSVSKFYCALGDFEIDLYNSSGFIKEIRSLKNNLVVTMSEHNEVN